MSPNIQSMSSQNWQQVFIGIVFAENRLDAKHILVHRDMTTPLASNTLWEVIEPPGGGPPPHAHSREEKGEITYQLGEDGIVATAGMFAKMPVGTPHSFQNESDRSAKMLISVPPAGLEKMFFEFGVPVV